MRECTFCEGTGEIMDSLSPNNGPNCHDCEACDGTGEVENDHIDRNCEWDYSKYNRDNYDEDIYDDSRGER